MEKLDKPLSRPPPDSATAESRLKSHLGHLTAAEEKAFTEFKELCVKEKLYKPAEASTKASHDDATLVRFLRARKFVPQDAFVQFKDTEAWRKTNELEALYDKIDTKDYTEARSVYPQWTGRRDKRGIPVYLYEVGKLDAKKMVAYTASTSKSKNKTSTSRMLRLFALYENLTRFVMPLCTAAPGRPNAETPVDQCNNIVDISGVGLKQFWNLKTHMQDASQLATAHYPETLDRIFLLGAPVFFPTVWGWIKRWFDPITTSKIFVLSSTQVLPTLKQFIDIENIPAKYGGQLKFECGDDPNLDPDLREYLEFASTPGSEKDFLTSPVRWLDSGDDGQMQAVGVGSRDGKQRQEQLATLQGALQRVATHRQILSRAPTRQTIPAASTASATPSLIAEPYAQTIGTESPASSTLAVPGQQPVTPNNAPPPKTEVAEPAIVVPGQQSVTTHAAQIPETKAVEPAVTGAGAFQSPLIPNGAVLKPDSIAIPPAPVELDRQKTEYLTPATDPSELKVSS